MPAFGRIARIINPDSKRMHTCRQLAGQIIDMGGVQTVTATQLFPVQPQRGQPCPFQVQITGLSRQFLRNLDFS
ncbi:hypothetical protein D3C73_1386630 [compost metagenome]